MRLIDADELMELLRLRKDSGIGTEIDEIKTVEAIPIEWIENKLNCCDNINAEIFVKALIREWENNEWLQ